VGLWHEPRRLVADRQPVGVLIVSMLAVFVVGPISLRGTNLLTRVSGVLAREMPGRLAG
jgi:hypothetical protein